MANSQVPITAGSGTNIDTELPAGGDHRQVIVVGDPATTAGVAPVTSLTGLRVEPYMTEKAFGATALAGFQQEDQPHVDGHAGVMMLGVRNHFSGSFTDGDYAAISVSSSGDMHTVSRKDLQRIAVTSAGLTNVTYAAGDQLGNLFTIAGAARLSGFGGVITGVSVIDQQAKIGAVDVVFFDSSVTLAADNVAFSISAADSLKVVGLAQLAGAYSLTNARLAQAQNLAIPYMCSGGTSLYAALITRSANAGITSGTAIQLNVYLERY
jgi:hypothetical protein